jgi:coenzyme F420-reducing hydrogenase gamma subunit
MPRKRNPSLAVWKFASCDGCQMSLFDGASMLLGLADAVDIAHFPELSRSIAKPPYDISLVEGSISTPRDVGRIQEVRRASKTLVTIGACATSGGIQALRNFAGDTDYVGAVYATPQYVSTLARSTAIGDHVAVDYELRGCPVTTAQVSEVLAALLNGRRPAIPNGSVCMECKRRGIVCGLVAFGPPCLGPVTQAGCGALCPTYHRGCYGCFGPKETANPAALAARWRDLGMSRGALRRTLRGVTAYAEPFRRESEAHEE